MNVGDEFNPSFESCGVHVHDIVGRQPWLTDGEKRVYDRLRRFAGRDGNCFPSQETLAYELGKSARQIRRDVARLEEVKLIGHRRGGPKSSRYVFLWHAIFECADRTPTSAQGGGQKGRPRPINEPARPDAHVLSDESQTGHIRSNDRTHTVNRPDAHVRLIRRNHHQQEKNQHGDSTEVQERRPVEAKVEPPLPLKADDDEKPVPESYATPTEELKARFVAKTGEALTIELLDAIRSNLGGDVTEDFVCELRKHNGRFSNYPGFVRDLSESFRLKTAKAAPASPQTYVLQEGEKCQRELRPGQRCGQRPGEGLDLCEGHAIPCPCATKEFIRRMEAKGILIAQAVQ